MAFDHVALFSICFNFAIFNYLSRVLVEGLSAFPLEKEPAFCIAPISRQHFRLESIDIFKKLIFTVCFCFLKR